MDVNNMTISSQIIEVLNDLCAKFGIAIDWSAENVLPYVQELTGKFISWEIATSWVWIVFSSILLVLGVILLALDVKTDFAIGGVGATIGFFIVVTSIIVIVCQVLDIVTCVHFPEKEIFEYVQTIIRSRQ